VSRLLVPAIGLGALLAILKPIAFADTSHPPEIASIQSAQKQGTDSEIINMVASELGIKKPPKLKYACSFSGHSGFLGLAAEAENTMILCDRKLKDPNLRHFVIVHELGHFKDFQSGMDSTEVSADKTAVDYFASKGLVGPIRSRANMNSKPEYKPGQNYARRVLSGQER